MDKDPIINPDNPEQKNALAEKERAFDEAFQQAVLSPDGLIELDSRFSKQEFLKYIVEKHAVILHGSNNQSISEFTPRQANDSGKTSGNQVAVYGTRDEVLPMFYAIQDRASFRGRVISGYGTVQDAEGTSTKEYIFEIEPEMLEAEPWSDGAVYILPNNTFEQVTDDNGKPVDEWASTSPVRPLAVMLIKPNEFPYIDSIKAIEGER